MLVLQIILALVVYEVQVQGASFEDNIKYYIYPPSGPRFQYTRSAVQLGCHTRGPWAFIVHGWLGDTVNSSWLSDLIRNLRQFRGGCIIAVDYSYYALNSQYFQVVDQFQGIGNAILSKMRQFLNEGFLVENGYMFGYSYGAHLVYHVGTQLGGRIPIIDTCEPSGIGFDWTPWWINPKNAGKNVQCINTSILAGTTTRECHQNWQLGYCGVYQPGSQGYPKGSHGLCPHIYNSAFRNSFFAEPNPYSCSLFVGKIAWYPNNLRMGYMDSVRLSRVRGTLFTQTYNTHNYARRG